MKDEIAKCITIDIVEDNRQQIIVDGIPQIARVAIGKCPACDKVLMNFGSGIIDLYSTLKFCNDNQEGLKNQMSYCVHCGQKLDYPILIEGEN